MFHFKNITCLLLLLSLNFINKAQNNFILNSGSITVVGDGSMHVDGSVSIKNNTQMSNNGAVLLTENWENNGMYNPSDSGTVILKGNNQTIGGSSITEFYNLFLKNNLTVKEAQNTFFISNKLDLQDAILETNKYIVHLKNSSSNSLTWNNGFLSTKNLESYFLRTTSSTLPYVYPTGSLNLKGYYRAIEIIPSNSDTSVFGARLSIGNATSSTGVSAAGAQAPYDLNNKQQNLGVLNPLYFHNLYRFSGNSEAQMNIYAQKSDFSNPVKGLAKWNSTNNEWEQAPFGIHINTAPSINNFGNPDIIAKSTQSLTYQDDVYVLEELKMKIPTTFTPNSDGVNDFVVFEGIEFYPEASFNVYTRWGELVYESKPYKNNWAGENKSKGTKIQGKELPEDTYFYILDLGQGIVPIKNYLELIRD